MFLKSRFAPVLQFSASRTLAQHPFSTILLCTLILFTGVSCGGGGGGGADEGDSGMNDGGGGSEVIPPSPNPQNSIISLSATADNNGVASVSFTLPEFTNKFSVTIESLGNLLRFIAVENDRGNEYVAPGGEEINLARELGNGVNAMNAPSRDFDPPVLDFAAYTARAAAPPGATVLFSVNTRTDTNLRNGALIVNVFRVGTAVQRSGAGASIDQALARMSEIWRLQAGVNVTINDFDIDGPDSIPDPGSAADFYFANTAAVPGPAINVFIGGDIDVPGSSTLGLASDIPGSPNATARSAVAISLFVSAGPDGRFSDDELRILGETIAHEMGHYAGLFHPIDIIGANVAFRDPLPDTADCTATINCLTNDDLIRNLMFPFTVPEDDSGETTVAQERLTSGQRGVLNLYSAVQ